MPILCPTCQLPVPDDALFCERDGTRLGPEPTEPIHDAHAPVAAVPKRAGCSCGAGPEAQTDGYCDACGRKWVAPRVPLARDHVEVALRPFLGGVTDRGQRHTRNEDDFALSITESGATVLVVCDGVSSSEESDRASAIAAKTLCDRLGQEDVTVDSFAAAFAGANAAVCALQVLAPGANSSPPETTAVATVVRDRTATIGWVGDSRAYWIDAVDPALSQPLTRDHSWMNDVVDSGEMTATEAEKNRLAHAITRCLGVFNDPESCTPTVSTFPFSERGGFLLLCSDGLWNYAPDTTQIAALVQSAPETEGVVAVARFLVAWANAQGGRDNITAVLLTVPAISHTEEETHEL